MPADGDGATSGSATSSGTPKIQLKTFDGAGNRIAKGGEKVTVGVKGPGHNDVVVKVSDRKDGLLEARGARGA